YRLRAVARCPAESGRTPGERQSQPGGIPRRLRAGCGADPGVPAGTDPGRAEGRPAAGAGRPADHHALRGRRSMNGFEQYLGSCQRRIGAYLDQLLSKRVSHLIRAYYAMRYRVTGGGKRIRPVLTYASCEVFGTAESAVDVAASAVELI